MFAYVSICSLNWRTNVDASRSIFLASTSRTGTGWQAALEQGRQLSAEVAELKQAGEGPLAEEDSRMKDKKKILVGLETLQRFVNKHHPKAKAAFEAFADQVRGPLDSVEGGP